MKSAPTNPSDVDCPEGSQFNQLALWTAATLAGLVTAQAMARTPFFRKLLGRIGRGKRSSRRPSGPQALPMLAGAILGSDKAMISAVLGPPRAAAMDGVGIVVHPQMVFWQSSLWYYPMPRDGMIALAITFDDDLATRVEFFEPPRLPA